ncbi:recombination regulator RecX [Gottfriedia acidiceleris]|uniref:recombination regulator RecX n=1 Tax=Bacillaceae TaxID=186817 RepID=UPI000BEB4F2A|nr:MULTISPECIES: recombination regulator RecX [unclassified Bacillus (in: firmicutes)]PEC48189.1 recombination regulator RecX [Bacillus sp. AFS096315]PFM83442.1 recombination regulator RecX [Bacillus sp. AFS077874]
MSIITKIQVQKINKERFNIYTDSGNGEEYSFSVDADTLVKFNIKKGQSFEPFELEEILNADQLRKAYLSSIVYLSRMMRTKKEIEQYLTKQEFLIDTIQTTIIRLVEEGYINEEKYAESYVRTSINTTLKGPTIIKNELLAKGIHNSVIEKSLILFPKDKQIQHAISLCQKKVSALSKYSTNQKKAKLEELLRRKGYSANITSIAIEETQYESEEDDELQALLIHARKAKKKYEKLSGWEYTQKMKTVLFRKGFPIDLIEKAILILEEEDLN